MKVLATLIIFYAIGMTGVFGDSCGLNPGYNETRKRFKVTGGENAGLNEFPWQVLVNEKGRSVIPHCGAVLIHASWVLTAKTCLPKKNQSIQLILGEYDFSSSNEPDREVLKKVVKIKNQYSRQLVLLKMESPIKTDNHIRPICLPAKGEDFTGQDAVVTGWGSVTFGGQVSEVLKKNVVPVQDNDLCKAKWPKFTFGKGLICAGYKNKTNFCESDYGGGLQVKKDGVYTLVGVASIVLEGKCQLPGIYAATSKFLGWINKIIK